LLLAEYDYDTDIAVQRAEAGRIAFAQGISQGITKGRSEGIAQGSYQTKIETAKNLLGLGLSIENIAQATGLSRQEVEVL